MCRKIFSLAALCAALVSCKKPLTKEALYGQWNYVKVENPNSHPPDSVKHSELAAAKPYILFSKDSLIMWWGGKELSHGTFTVAGDSIEMNEILLDRTTRKFAFHVSELTDKEIIFSTRGEDGSEVTAVKQ